MFPRIFFFYILLMVLMLLSYEVFSQKNPENLVTDTLKDKKQSGLIKGLIDLVSKDTLPKENTDFQKSIADFTGYNGWIISDIHIKKVAVIEGNVEDTSAVASTWLGKAGDNLHIYTKEKLIRKSLLFQEGDKVDPFVLADSERILRSYRYIEDARIWVIPKDEENVVDIIVVIKDAFSIGVNGSVSSLNKFDIRLYDVNFLGLGSELSIKTRYNSSWAPKMGYEGRYYVNNFGKSFISGEVGYFHTGTLEGITTTFERPLISTEFTYYGGISLSNLKRNRKEEINDSISVEIPYSLANADIWLGRLFKPGGKEKQNYLAVGVRFNRDNFVIRPVVGPDANIFFHDRQLFLASMEFFRHNFIKTKKLLGFGRVEDVRTGFTMRLTGGFEISEFLNQR